MDLRLSTRPALALALALGAAGFSTRGHASGSSTHVISNFTAELGHDLGVGNYSGSTTANGGRQCRGSVAVFASEPVSITRVVVEGTSFAEPNAVVVHRPGRNGSPKTPSGTSGEWSVITHEHDGDYAPNGVWAVVLPKIPGETCRDSYDDEVTIWITGQALTR